MNPDHAGRVRSLTPEQRRELGRRLRSGAGRRSRLVAFVVPAGDTAPDLAELYAHARARLPAAMVPGSMVFVDALPRTPAGKLDANRLARSVIGTPAPPAAPRDDVERELVELWTAVLRADHVGVHDDFFADLGGHSLLATRLLARIRERMGVDLTLRSIFERPTIAGVADQIRDERARGPAGPLPSIPQVSRESRRMNLDVAAGRQRDGDAARG